MAKKREGWGVDERREGYRIAWWCADVGDWGLCVGPDEVLADDPDVSGAAILCAAAGVPHDGAGYLFATERDAGAILRQHADAMAGRPWPEWAVEAQRAGWRAPTGWTP